MDYSTEITVHASIDEVFHALTSGSEIERWTGERATFEPRPGGQFEMFSGAILGFVDDFHPPGYMTQRWRFNNWPEYSHVTFTISSKADDTTSIRMDHTDVPPEAYEEISHSWVPYYLDPLRRHCETAS